jgi:hypothetical protein
MKAERWSRAVLIVTLLMPLASAAAQPAGHSASHPAGHAEDAEGTHNMLVVGEETVFLSHLPMFQGVNPEKTGYTSEHRYQVILEATFTKDGKDVTKAYTQDRKSHPSLGMYTLKPKDFVLPRLFRPTVKPVLGSFVATVHRGHLERGGPPVAALEGVEVHVRKVVYADEFDPAREKPEKLTYVLFGRGEELFLAHWITTPPDFDQVLPVRLKGHAFTDQDLDRGIEIVFLDRADTASQRLKPMQEASGRAHVTGAHQFHEVQVQTGKEAYFEEGELAIPHTFRPTPEEARSGLGE